MVISAYNICFTLTAALKDFTHSNAIKLSNRLSAVSGEWIGVLLKADNFLNIVVYSIAKDRKEMALM